MNWSFCSTLGLSGTDAFEEMQKKDSVAQLEVVRYGFTLKKARLTMRSPIHRALALALVVIALAVGSVRGAVDFSIEIQRGRNALRTYWAPDGEFYGIDARVTVTPVGATNYLHSPNTNHSWRVGPGEFAPDQILPGSGGRLYYALGEALTEMTNGLWTLVLNENAPNQEVYRFKIDAGDITTNTLALPEITFPADDSANISTTPEFTWTLPRPVGSIELSLGVTNSAYVFLPANTTTWTPESPLTLGDTEVNLVTKTNGAGLVLVGTPTNAVGQPLAGWTSTSVLNVRRTHQFFVGPRLGGSSLIAHLRFEQADFLGLDSSPRSNHANEAWVGSQAGQDADGIEGSSLRMTAGDQAELRWDQTFVRRISRGFTVSAWIKTTQDFGPGDGDWGAGVGIVGAQACCDGRDFAPLVLNGGYVLFNTGDGQGSGQTLSSTEVANTGDWVHLVATRDGLTGLMSLYVNGELDGTLQPMLNAVLDAPDHLTVGSLGNFNNHYDGLIDDLQIYTNAVSAVEARYLYEHPGETVAGLSVTGGSLGDAVDAPQLTWTSGGAASWVYQTETTDDGADAAQSGSVPEFGESWIETTLEGPGELEFRWRVSSEFDVDYLEFTMDDSFQSELGGDTEWESYVQDVPPGEHRFRWRFYQQDVPSAGIHAGWLDQVRFRSGSAPAITVEPFDQTTYPGYSVALLAAATGNPTPTWQWYKVGAGPIAGATNALYVPASSGTAAAAGQYYAEASNTSGTTATRTVTVTFANANQPPEWSTAFASPLSFGDLQQPKTNYGIACLLDPTGNIYAANSFSTSSTEIGTNMLTAGPGRFGTALLKHTPNGAVLWARGITNDGSGNSFPQCLAPAPGNGVYLAGVFLGTNWLGTNRLVESAGATVYLARFDSEGQVLWVRTIGGTNAAFLSYHQLVADPAGNVTVSALIQNYANVGPTNVVVSGQRGVLAQFDANGALRWVDMPSGWVQYMAASGGRIYAALGAGETNYIGGATNTSDRRWILAALDGADGRSLWLRAFGSHRDEGGFRDTPAIAVAGSDVFLVGTAYGANATFGSISVPTSGGQYLARFNTNGTAELATTFGSSTTVPWGAVADASGNVYVAADYDHYAVFGQRLLAGPRNDMLAEGFPSQCFLAKFDRQGALLWARKAESGASYVNVRDLVAAPDGVWACGFVSQQARFGTFDVFGPSVCIGSPFCFIQVFVGGWLGKIVDGVAPTTITLLNPRQDGSRLSFDFSSQGGRAYTVEYRDDAGSGPWSTLTNLAGDGTLKTITRPASAPARFFRVRTP